MQALEAHEDERVAQPCHFEDAIDNSCDKNFDEDSLLRIEVSNLFLILYVIKILLQRFSKHWFRSL